MTPAEVHQVLTSIGAKELHHANTVTTSCTFLEHGALLSRGFVERNGLAQTAQGSDAIDKKFGIWDAVFLDHVDIHLRGGRVKGPNQYGPVLFTLDIDVLLKLPTGTDVRVTRKNPVYWTDGQPDGDRWYLTAAELSRSISFGDFDKMVVVFTPDGKVEFGDGICRVALDDPKRKLGSGIEAYEHAKQRLTEAARVGRVDVAIDAHRCRGDCVCEEKYAGYNESFFESRFV